VTKNMPGFSVIPFMPLTRCIPHHIISRSVYAHFGFGLLFGVGVILAVSRCQIGRSRQEYE